MKNLWTPAFAGVTNKGKICISRHSGLDPESRDYIFFYDETNKKIMGV